jgi:CHAT domain-containing protein
VIGKGMMGLRPLFNASKLITWFLAVNPQSSVIFRITRVTAVVVVLTFFYLDVFAQIPKNPNQGTKKGKRQGTWTILYDKDWGVTTSEDRAEFYRIISYANDKPVGRVKDFYLSGQLQCEMTLLADRPEAIHDGVTTWYTIDGIKQVERGYSNGELLTEVFFKKDGTRSLLKWEQMDSVAEVLAAQGKTSERVAVLEEARYQAELELGKGDMMYLYSCITLGDALWENDRPAEAEQLYVDARKQFLELFGSAYTGYGSLCNKLALIYNDLGDYGKTEAFYKEAADVFLKLKDSLNYAQVRKNIGIVYKNLGRYEESEAILLNAKDIIQKVAPNSEYYANACEQLASLNIEWTNKMYGFRNARDYYMEALEVYKRTVGENHRAYAQCLVAYSRFVAASNPAEAERMLLEAREIRSQLGKENPEYQKTNYNLAHYYRKMDSPDKAKPYYEEMKNFQLRQLRKNFVTLSEKEQQLYFQSVKFFFDDYVSFYLDNWGDSTAAGKIYDLQLVVKGFLYQSTVKTRMKILSSGDSVLIRLYQTLKSKREQLAGLYRLTEDEIKKQNINTSNLEEDANRLEKEINSRASKYGIKDIDEEKILTWKDVRNKLKKGEAAIEMIRAAQYTWGNATEPVYLAMIITPETRVKPMAVLWRNGFELENRHLKFYRNNIANQLDDNESYHAYWGDAIPSYLNGAKKIFFSPDGVFHQISLPTLKNPATGKFLDDEVRINVIGSTRDLVQPLKISKATKTILFGFPDYKDGGTKETSIASDRKEGSALTLREFAGKGTNRFFDPRTSSVIELPGTREEVTSIHQMLINLNLPVTLYTEKTASEKNLKGIKDPRILHIATHGFFLPDAEIEVDQGKNQAVSQNPLLRSGLLLAGCEPSLQGKASAKGEEDGILTAYEAMNLFLEETDIVVLSACETGLGEIQNGEGVYGLQRAFQEAGAKSILISLWKVSDSATQLLMTTLYEEFLKSNNLRASFAKAQMEVRKKYPEPYYWGAFVLIGG